MNFLAEKLDVSEATVRRDLAALNELGQLQRVRGGVIPVNAEVPPFPDGALIGQQVFDEGRIEHAERKSAIGAKAAEFCEPGEPIIIDGGSTTFMMARHLENLPYQVLTTSLSILQYLLRLNKVRILTPGGAVFREQNVVLSPYEEGLLSNFAASKLFIGAQAIGLSGLMQSDPLLVQSERNLIERAKEIIVLADSSKFSRHSPLVLCSLEKIDRVITDDLITPSARKCLEGAGVEVVTVEAPESTCTGSRYS